MEGMMGSLGALFIIEEGRIVIYSFLGIS